MEKEKDETQRSFRRAGDFERIEFYCPAATCARFNGVDVIDGILISPIDFEWQTEVTHLFDPPESDASVRPS